MSSFGHAQESVQPMGELELEAKKESLLQDIKDLGTRKELLEKSVSEFKDLSKEKEDLTTAIAVMKADVKSLQQEFLTEQGLLKQVLDDKITLISEVSKLTEDKTSLEISVSKFLLKFGTDSVASWQSDNELATKKKDLKSVTDTLDEKTKSLEEIQSKSDAFEGLIKLQKKEIAKDELIKKEVEGALETFKAFSTSQIAGIRASVLDEENKLKDAEKLVQESTDKADKILSEAFSKKERIDLEITDKELSLTAREGDLNVREGWLIEKTAALQTAKDELEKFYNRKITHVNL